MTDDFDNSEIDKFTDNEKVEEYFDLKAEEIKENKYNFVKKYLRISKPIISPDNKLFTFTINCDGFIDPNNFGLKFTIVNKNKHNYIQLDGSPHSIIKSITFSHRGQILEQITDYDVIVNLLNDITYKENKYNKNTDIKSPLLQGTQEIIIPPKKCGTHYLFNPTQLTQNYLNCDYINDGLLEFAPKNYYVFHLKLFSTIFGKSPRKSKLVPLFLFDNLELTIEINPHSFFVPIFDAKIQDLTNANVNNDEYDLYREYIASIKENKLMEEYLTENPSMKTFIQKSIQPTKLNSDIINTFGEGDCLFEALSLCFYKDLLNTILVRKTITDYMRMEIAYFRDKYANLDAIKNMVSSDITEPEYIMSNYIEAIKTVKSENLYGELILEAASMAYNQTIEIYKMGSNDELKFVYAFNPKVNKESVMLLLIEAPKKEKKAGVIEHEEDETEINHYNVIVFKDKHYGINNLLFEPKDFFNHEMIKKYFSTITKLNSMNVDVLMTIKFEYLIDILPFLFTINDKDIIDLGKSADGKINFLKENISKKELIKIIYNKDWFKFRTLINTEFIINPDNYKLATIDNYNLSSNKDTFLLFNSIFDIAKVNSSIYTYTINSKKEKLEMEDLQDCLKKTSIVTDLMTLLPGQSKETLEKLLYSHLFNSLKDYSKKAILSNQLMENITNVFDNLDGADMKLKTFIIENCDFKKLTKIDLPTYVKQKLFDFDIFSFSEQVNLNPNDIAHITAKRSEFFNSTFLSKLINYFNVPNTISILKRYMPTLFNYEKYENMIQTLLNSINDNFGEEDKIKRDKNNQTYNDIFSMVNPLFFTQFTTIKQLEEYNPFILKSKRSKEIEFLEKYEMIDTLVEKGKMFDGIYNFSNIPKGDFVTPVVGLLSKLFYSVKSNSSVFNETVKFELPYDYWYVDYVTNTIFLTGKIKMDFSGGKRPSSSLNGGNKQGEKTFIGNLITNTVNTATEYLIDSANYITSGAFKIEKVRPNIEWDLNKNYTREDFIKLAQEQVNRDTQNDQYYWWGSGKNPDSLSVDQYATKYKMEFQNKRAAEMGNLGLLYNTYDNTSDYLKNLDYNGMYNTAKNIGTNIALDYGEHKLREKIGTLPYIVVKNILSYADKAYLAGGIGLAIEGVSRLPWLWNYITGSKKNIDAIQKLNENLREEYKQSREFYYKAFDLNNKQQYLNDAIVEGLKDNYIYKVTNTILGQMANYKSNIRAELTYINYYSLLMSIIHSNQLSQSNLKNMNINNNFNGFITFEDLHYIKTELKQNDNLAIFLQGKKTKKDFSYIIKEFIKRSFKKWVITKPDDTKNEIIPPFLSNFNSLINESIRLFEEKKGNKFALDNKVNLDFFVNLKTTIDKERDEISKSKSAIGKINESINNIIEEIFKIITEFRVENDNLIKDLEEKEKDDHSLKNVIYSLKSTSFSEFNLNLSNVISKSFIDNYKNQFNNEFMGHTDKKIQDYIKNTLNNYIEKVKSKNSNLYKLYDDKDKLLNDIEKNISIITKLIKDNFLKIRELIGLVVNKNNLSKLDKIRYNYLLNISLDYTFSIDEALFLINLPFSSSNSEINRFANDIQKIFNDHIIDWDDSVLDSEGDNKSFYIYETITNKKKTLYDTLLEFIKKNILKSNYEDYQFVFYDNRMSSLGGDFIFGQTNNENIFIKKDDDSNEWYKPRLRPGLLADSFIIPIFIYDEKKGRIAVDDAIIADFYKTYSNYRTWKIKWENDPEKEGKQKIKYFYTPKSFVNTPDDQQWNKKEDEENFYYFYDNQLPTNVSSKIDEKYPIFTNNKLEWQYREKPKYVYKDIDVSKYNKFYYVKHSIKQFISPPQYENYNQTYSEEKVIEIVPNLLFVYCLKKVPIIKVEPVNKTILDKYKDSAQQGLNYLKGVFTKMNFYYSNIDKNVVDKEQKKIVDYLYKICQILLEHEESYASIYSLLKIFLPVTFNSIYSTYKYRQLYHKDYYEMLNLIKDFDMIIKQYNYIHGTKLKSVQNGIADLENPMTYKDIYAALENKYPVLSSKHMLEKQSTYEILNTQANVANSLDISKKFYIKNIEIELEQINLSDKTVYNYFLNNGYSIRVTNYEIVKKEYFIQKPPSKIVLLLQHTNASAIYNIIQNTAYTIYPTCRKTSRYSRLINKYTVSVDDITYPINQKKGNCSNSFTNYNFTEQLANCFPLFLSNINQLNYSLDISTSLYVTHKLYGYPKSKIINFGKDTNYMMNFIFGYNYDVNGKHILGISFNKLMADLKQNISLLGKKLEINIESEIPEEYDNGFEPYEIFTIIESDKIIQFNKDGNIN